ncbi:Mov34/MPN/PAD-1 family protein [Sediminibacillus massiliensis]|uniref:Mov34/MPN/PAD-1 family protein n=1 Tax=Sediminibacillus massiliensis TaxID=1926277 RepID=UPI0015C3013C|nr:M67 family metallopeptidase [Sediminibacillus massiliensis]
MFMQKLFVSESVYQEMLEHGRDNLPYEACGLLSGNGSRINHFWPLVNEIQSASRFFIKKETVEKNIKKIDHLEEQVLAIYHTHPTTAPVPSSYDLLHHPDENISMVIISYKTETPIARCYFIQGSTYDEGLFCVQPT